MQFQMCFTMYIHIKFMFALVFNIVGLVLKQLKVFKLVLVEIRL